MNDQQTLVAQIVPFLLARGYAPNERAPSERELAERFRASRTQVREALSVLETLRVIERRPKSGIYLTTGSASIEALALFADIGIPFSEDDIHQVVEVRRIQELEAIRLACRRHTDDDVAALRRCLADSGSDIADGEDMAALDRVFHCGIVTATQNAVLLRLVNIFYLMTERRREYYFRDAERRRRSHAEHEQIFQALLDRDEDRAVSLLDAHLVSADGYWRGLLET